MFWGQRGTKPIALPATSDKETSHWLSQYKETTATSTVSTLSSYGLSKQRHRELLQAARTNRVSWIDGVDMENVKALRMGSNTFIQARISSSMPIHSREALEGVNLEFSKFFTCLEELKRKIQANDLDLIKKESQGSDTAQICSDQYHSLFQELQNKKSLISKWQRSHTPSTRKLTAHDREMVFLVGFWEFTVLLKNTQAAELVYRIQSFAKKVELWDLPQMLRASATKDRPGEKIQEFISNLIAQIKNNKKLSVMLQSGADNDDATLQQQNYLHIRDASGVDLLHEVLEAFLMEKVYVKTLTPSVQVARKDNAFHERISLLSFVTFKHLDLPVPKCYEQEQRWLRLARQLEAMTLCPSPRRKMDGILRVCQDLTMFLKVQNGGRFPSADEFLPALIFVVLRANPRELKRNVAFILEYRNPTKLVSEPGYFLTHVISSIAFLEQVDSSRLTISPEEFDQGLHRSKESLKLDSAYCGTVHTATSDGVSNNIEVATNCNATSFRNKCQKQVHHLHVPSGCNKHDTELPVRLPTVLEVRAKRLGSTAEG